MTELGEDLNAFELQDIKYEPITEEQIDQMKALAGSYESLFDGFNQRNSTSNIR